MVTSDLEDAYFPSPSFPITGSSWGVLWGQSLSISDSSLRPCTLPPISSSERMAVWHRGVVLAHLKDLGLRLNVIRVCFSNRLSGRGVGSDHDAGMYVPCSDWVNPHVSQNSKRRPVTYCQAVSKSAGSDVSCVQCDNFWPAVHETPTVVAQDQGVPPTGKPTLHDQGHEAMPTCLRHVEETLGICLRAWCWELLVAA